MHNNELFNNREFSLLEFHRRVLAQAFDESIPLLERLRFLCISCSNLDEFFELRVAALKQRMQVDGPAPGPDNRLAADVFDELSIAIADLVQQQYSVLNDVLFPELSEQGVRFLPEKKWTEEQSLWIENYFQTNVEPVVSPLTYDPSQPFPRILNKSLNFILRLHGKDAYGQERHRAILQIPRVLPRLIQVPAGYAGSTDFVFLSSIVHAHVARLFVGLQVDECSQFRVTRNSNLYIDNEEVEDLVSVLAEQLAMSGYGAAVRLEVEAKCSDDSCAFLLKQFVLGDSDLYRVDGPVNLNRLAMICDIPQHEKLRYPPFKPGIPAPLRHQPDIFAVLKQRDVFLHHPYQSFIPVVDFIATAAADSSVLAIKQTLYRSGTESPVVEHLIAAALAGKEVTVVIELMARFDEAANIALATRLQEVGVQVYYGLVGFKAHAKMALVVRREDDELVRYVHLGTGNYHSVTTRVYTDYGLLSSDRKLGEDTHTLFMRLTTLTSDKPLHAIIASPFDLYDAVMEHIHRETQHARDGKRARIIAKVNALTDTGVIKALYEASSSGVRVDLLVRGICCLRPGIPGLSENIRVHSIVGRFLEHSRIYFFRNDGDSDYFCSSADWMDRNFFRRTEIAFPVRDPALRERLQDELDLMLGDDRDAWVLQPNGSYQRREHGSGKSVSAQKQLLKQLASDSLPGSG